MRLITATRQTRAGPVPVDIHKRMRIWDRLAIAAIIIATVCAAWFVFEMWMWVGGL